jgi:RNA polymerase sigma-70 factor (ECF subfamily)
MGKVSTSATLELLVADSSWLRRLAFALVKDEATAEDLVQDTYTIAATQTPTDGQPLRPWLARVLWNRLRTARRGDRRRRDREHAFGEHATAPARPDEIVDRIEVQRMLAGFVLELAAPQRDVVLLHYFEGLTSKQIGLRLGIASGTVRWRLKQAVDELRERMEQRSPNRAWLPPLVALARTTRSAKVVLLPKLLFVAFILLAIVGFVLRAQLDQPVRATPMTRAAHSSAVSSGSAMLSDTSLSGDVRRTLGAEPTFGAEQRSLRGIVIDLDGRGVEGADVVLDCGYVDGFKQHTRSRIGGAFELEADSRCSYVLIATKGDARGEQSSSGVAIDERAFTPGEMPSLKSKIESLNATVGGPEFERLRTVIQLRPLSTTVVHVVDAETGAPLAGAKISSGWSFDDGVSAVSGPDGLARLSVQLPANLTVEAARYASARELVADPRRSAPNRHGTRGVIILRGSSVTDASAVNLEVRLRRGIAVSGTVIGTDGLVVSDARVVFSRPPEETSDAAATTDANGHFETNVPSAGGYHLVADRRDLTSDGVIVVQIPVEGRTDLVARVAPRGEIRGAVVDLGNKPVAGARVSLVDGSRRPVATDATGSFAIENIAGAVDLIANRGSDASAILHVQIKSGERADVVLQIGPSGIAGIAIDRDGVPVPGADVYLNECCETNPHVVPGRHFTSDASGTFAVDTPRGNFVLSVRRNEDDGYDAEDDVKVAGGSHGVRLLVP